MEFKDLNLNPSIIKAVDKMGYFSLTPIQEQVLPVALEKTNQDIIGQAPTGTGKTCAFALPILNKLDVMGRYTQALILAPTRELANQIKEDICDYAAFLPGVEICALYGGEDYEKQFKALKHNPQILVCTPGRLMDHIRRGTVNLTAINTLVLDEADEMLDMGFREDIDTILESINHAHQTMLFFATISSGIEAIAKNYLTDPLTFRVANKNTAAKTIKQRFIECDKDDKIEIISRIIDINEYKLVIIFCNTKLDVDYVTSSLIQRGFIAEGLHGDMRQMQRDNVMNRFKSGSINILVASDVAARGLDVDDVDVVFNYDVPTDDEYYVHRIGRTGRAQKEGLAILLVTRNEKYRMHSIMAYSKSNIEKMEVPPLEEVLKARAKRLISKAIQTIPPKREELIIEQAIDEVIQNEVNGYDLIAGLITLKLQENINQEIKDLSSGDGMSRVFISVGRKDGFNTPGLVKYISKIANIKKDDILKVDVHESYSFFNIPKEYVNDAINAFANMSVDGNRKIILEEAKSKEKEKHPAKKKQPVPQYDYAHHGKRDRHEASKAKNSRGQSRGHGRGKGKK